MNRLRLLFVAGLLASPACSNSPGGSAGESYARGVAALQSGQPRIARVEFMNAIKADPGNGTFRLMQARTYLLIGDGVAAEAELVRAHTSGIKADSTRHLVAHALLLQGKPERALEEAVKTSPAFAAYGARIRGRALLAIGDEQQAATAFNEALAVSPEESDSWTDIARFRRVGGDLAGAIAAADRAVTLNARNVEALSFRGELTRSQYGLDAAMAWFDRALEIDPGHVPTLVERAATLGDLGQMKEMLAATRKIVSLAPNNPTAYFLQASLAARAGKFDLAQSLYQRTRGLLDDQPSALLLAGAIDLETGNVERSIQRLRRLVGMQPENAKARRLLASAQWRQGDAGGVIATLQPLADRRDGDVYALTLIGKAWARKGNAALAGTYFARASWPRGRWATALIGEPVDDIQLEALRRNADNSPQDAASQIRLIRALLGRGLEGEAIGRARYLQDVNPGAPDAHILVGDALAIQGDFAAAAQQYRKAANIAFTEPVALRLVEALGAAGDSVGAARVLNLFLQQNPQNVPGQILAAASFVSNGEWDSAILLYERLRKRLGDRDATILNNLAWAYSEKGDYRTALPLARRAWELDPRNPSTADTLGWLLFKSGADRARGLSLLQQVARGEPADGTNAQHATSATSASRG